LAGAVAAAQDSKPSSVAPIPASQKPAWSHAPYEVGQCDACHASNDRASPGKARTPLKDVCFVCHDEFRDKIVARKIKHPSFYYCTKCHNPHNGSDAMLLAAPLPALCLSSCHEKIAKSGAHPSGPTGKPPAKLICPQCHEPHAADIEHLIKKP